MFKTFNLIVIVGFSLLYSQAYGKEISQDKKYLSSSIEEIAEEMVNLNSSLNVLSITISNLVPRNNI